MRLKFLLIGLASIGVASLSFIPPATAQSTSKLAQGSTQVDRDRQRRLEQQAEAERALKEGERLRREIRDRGFGGGNLERRVNEQIIKIRESGTNPQRVREAQTELQRLREQRNRRRYYDYYPYYGDRYYPIITAPIITSPIIITPIITAPIAPIAPIAPTQPTPFSESPLPPSPPINQTQFRHNSPNISISAGVKDGLINPAIGVRWRSFGVEVGAIFDRDALPSTLNDFSLPANFLFNDLGIKKISDRYGADILGYIDVNPTLSIRGGVGLYFQSKSRIAQSQATNELYKQTDETAVTPAVSVGIDYSVSDAIDLGIGYHSLRGLNGKIGISF